MSVGVRPPGDTGCDEYLRNGYAAGIEGLWVLGRITIDTMIADLKALLHHPPGKKPTVWELLVSHLL